METFPRARARQAAPVLRPKAKGASRISSKSWASPQSEAGCLCQTASVKTLCCRTLSGFRALDQFDKLGRHDRHLRYAHAEWRQRVLNRGYDRGSGRNDADFADAFY